MTQIKFSSLINIYRQIRPGFPALMSAFPVERIRESIEQNYAPIKERFLQALWNERCLDMPRLQLSNGKKLRIINPGTWNCEAGPDFKDACLLIDNKKITGNVEIHINSSDWEKHGHSLDKRYENLILHVVWEKDSTVNDLPHCPTLILEEQPDCSTEKILNNNKIKYYSYSDKVPEGQCAIHLTQYSKQELREIFCVAGTVRFRDKTESFLKRIIDVGEEQACYEGLADAAGYKNNRKKFSRIAEMLPIKQIKDRSAEEIKAMLLGSAGLLPDPTTTNVHPEKEKELKNLWKIWWKRQDKYLSVIKCNRMGRPTNSAERRLVWLADFIARHKGIPNNKFAEILKSTEKNKNIRKELHNIFDVENLWYDFRDFSTKMKRGAQLVGTGRKDDIIVNIILPFIAATARKNKDVNLLEKTEKIFLSYRPLQSNKIFKNAMHKMIFPTGRHKDIITSSGVQQGLYQIYTDFCNRNASCKDCQFLKQIVQLNAGKC
ncbi:MAG: DUF2851 family protein [Verrucomicrobiota bacterium]|nr:DUF2851 family protein [Verrucomicrobiota bacterium]